MKSPGKLNTRDERADFNPKWMERVRLCERERWGERENRPQTNRSTDQPTNQTNDIENIRCANECVFVLDTGIR